MIARFFPGAREELAAIDDEIVREALGPVQEGKAHCFEDQYICTRRPALRADRRPRPVRRRPAAAGRIDRCDARGLSLGICCHPYDLATELIAREAGVIVVDPSGAPIRAPLDIEADVAWAGYANPAIRAQIEPLLHEALRVPSSSLREGHESKGPPSLRLRGA